MRLGGMRLVGRMDLVIVDRAWTRHVCAWANEVDCTR